MTKNLAVVSGLSILIIAGCQDPFTRMMKENGFTPLIPVEQNESLGNIYSTVDLGANRQPYCILTDPTNPQGLKDLSATLMRDDAANPVVLMTDNFNSSWNLDATASVIGKFSVELHAKGVTKYTVKLGDDAKRYEFDQRTWENVIIPAYQVAALRGKNTDGKFVVCGLLRVSSLQYTFSNDQSGTVNIKTDPALSNAITATLGVGWGVSDEGTLSFSGSPRFIGYKVARIDGNAMNPVAAATPAKFKVIGAREIEAELH